MCNKVREMRADFGIALDGDADRVVMADEKGNIIDGDQILALIAKSWSKNDKLKGGGVVGTVMSNAGLDRYLQTLGLTLGRSAVGDRYVLEEMAKGGFNVGGEQSGHIILSDFSTTGDGLVAALQILRIMKTRGVRLSELVRCWTRFPQLVTNVVVREKKPFDSLDGVNALVAAAEAEITPTGGRVLLRYSGTEPKARLLLEGRDLAVLQKWSGQICTVIKRQVGA